MAAKRAAKRARADPDSGPSDTKFDAPMLELMSKIKEDIKRNAHAERAAELDQLEQMHLTPKLKRLKLKLDQREAALAEREKTLGAKWEEVQQWKKKVADAVQSGSDRINMDFRGTRFSLSRQALTRGDNFFSKMIAIEQPDPGSKSYLIDRDPTYVPAILRYLSNIVDEGVLHTVPELEKKLFRHAEGIGKTVAGNEWVEEFKAELNFYGLDVAFAPSVRLLPSDSDDSVTHTINFTASALQSDKKRHFSQVFALSKYYFRFCYKLSTEGDSCGVWWEPQAGPHDDSIAWPMPFNVRLEAIKGAADGALLQSRRLDTPEFREWLQSCAPGKESTFKRWGYNEFIQHDNLAGATSFSLRATLVPLPEES